MIAVDANAPEWAHRFATDVGQALRRLQSGIQSIPKADLPTQGNTRIAVVPDEAGGATLAFFDTATGEWKRATDLAVVS